jgi:Exportin 1-like protein
MSILYDNPALVLGAKHTMSKYALIYVHMIKWDFPMSWSSAFNELISLMSISQDVNLQKVYLKFIV